MRRVPNPADGRSAFAEITAAGRAAFRKAAPVYLDRIRHHLGSHLTGPQARQLRRLLELSHGEG